MTLLSNFLNITGLVILNHAVYSAYEHTSLLSSTSTSEFFLPLDITLETLFSVLLLCTGIVLGAGGLRPIGWGVWAREVEMQWGREAKGAGKAGEDAATGIGMGIGFRGLEERAGFVDIRAKRKELADWVRDADTLVKT